MNCKKCDCLLAENDKYCRNCGTPVNDQNEIIREENNKQITVNRVFCYSKDEALKNGNRLPIMELVLTFLIFCIILIAVSVGKNAFMVQSDIIDFIVGTILPLIISGLTIYYSVILGIRIAAKISGFAITDDNRIFRVAISNNGQGLVLGGAAVGSMIDKLSNSNKNIGRDIGGAIGAASQIYIMNKNAEYMSHPEIIAKIVESDKTVKGVFIIEILKVHSISEGKHSFKVNCDFKIINMNKTRYNKNFYIPKSYNQINDLIDIIKRK